MAPGEHLLDSRFIDLVVIEQQVEDESLPDLCERLGCDLRQWDEGAVGREAADSARPVRCGGQHTTATYSSCSFEFSSSGSVARHSAAFASLPQASWSSLSRAAVILTTGAN
jgi:hypothetical protein